MDSKSGLFGRYLKVDFIRKLKYFCRI